MKKKSIYLISLFLLFLDQISKFLTMKFFLKELIVIPNFFSIYYLENSGAAFGILQGQRIFLLMISAAVLIIFSKIIREEKEITKFKGFVYALIVGGITGNFLDRVFIGKVRDFLSFIILNKNMPVFNLADVFITVGVILLIIIYLKEDLNAYQSRRKSS